MTRPMPEHSFQLRYVFNASRSIVFRAWTDAEVLKQWFRPAGHNPTAINIDLRVGGKLYIAMETKDGETYHFRGEFQEVIPPTKIALTWFCSLHDYINTRLTLEFHERETSTEVILTHEGFTDESTMTDFLNGWPSAIVALRHLVEEG